MNRTLIAAAGFALATASGLAGAASWTVVVQPGVYGRVPIGGYAEPPQVYAPQPVMVVDNGYGQMVQETVAQAYATDQMPVYLWVPEYQRTHWAQYCGEYGAYGVPVYFVDDTWYRDNVMRRNWTAEQRSWSPQQWLAQDRIARDRFERQRFEQQRYEQQARDQQRLGNERAWQQQRQPGYGAAQGQQPAQAAAAQTAAQAAAAQAAAPAQLRGGAPGRNGGDRRVEGRERGEGRGRDQGDGRGGREHGRDGNHER